MRLLYAIHKYDVFMFSWLINASIHNSMAKVSRYVSRTGDGGLHVLVMAFLYWQEGSRSLALQAMLLAFAIERPVYFILKNGFKRNRPEAALKNFHSLIKPSDQFSFPSGHTSAAFVMAALLGHFFPLSAVTPLLLGRIGWLFPRGAGCAFPHRHPGRLHHGYFYSDL